MKNLSFNEVIVIAIITVAALILGTQAISCTENVFGGGNKAKERMFQEALEKINQMHQRELEAKQKEAHVQEKDQK